MPAAESRVAQNLLLLQLAFFAYKAHNLLLLHHQHLYAGFLRLQIAIHIPSSPFLSDQLWMYSFYPLLVSGSVPFSSRAVVDAVCVRVHLTTTGRHRFMSQRVV